MSRTEPRAEIGRTPARTAVSPSSVRNPRRIRSASDESLDNHSDEDEADDDFGESFDGGFRELGLTR